MVIAKYFDVYSRRARLLPALLALLPGFIACATLFPDFYASVSSAGSTLVISSGSLVLFASAARFLGRKKELELFAVWGGMPTTIWLRHRDINLDAMTKKRCHEFLSRNVPKLKLPSANEEKRNSIKADELYRSGVKWLLEYTRDKKKFPLVFEENVNYGFQRNTLALKPVGLLVSIGTFLVALLIAGRRHDLILDQLERGEAVAMFISVLALAAWVLIVSPTWVKDAADAYARALLAACDK